MASGAHLLVGIRSSVWRGEETLLVITGAEPQRAVHVQLPSNSLEITVQLQWLLTRTNCTTAELPSTLKTNGLCGNLEMGRVILSILGTEQKPTRGWPRIRWGLLGIKT